MNKLSTNIDPNQKLYRFVSFYDAYDIVVNKKLRFSKLSTFDDKNEGVGHILQFQEHELFRYKYIEEAGINEGYDFMQENHYLSCWSTEPDMVAMWALYSQDCSSIRVSTTAGKLFDSLKELYDRYLYTNYKDIPGSRKHVSWYYKLNSVKYVDFTELRDNIRNKFNAFRAHSSKMAKQKKDYHESDDGFRKDYAKLHENKVVNEDGIFLKDKSYFHESEVRAVLFCGVRNNVTFDEWKKDTFQGLHDAAETGELPEYIYSNLPVNFLNDICFDPRMPKYKKKIMTDIFGDDCPNISGSPAFGHVLEQEDFTHNEYD